MPIKFANIGPKVPFRYNSIDGEITVTQGAIYIETYEVHAIKDLCAVLNIPYTQGDIVQRFTGSNALDILGILIFPNSLDQRCPSYLAAFSKHVEMQ
jgi:hypothetical protein